MHKVRNIIIGVCIIVLIVIAGILIFKYLNDKNKTSEVNDELDNIKLKNVHDINMQKLRNENILPNYEEFVYGTTVNGRELKYYSISPDIYDSTILFVFAIHGYEDLYDKDAQVLVDTANYLVETYKQEDVSVLSNSRLLIVPCANPDGLYDGNSNNGFGRCNADGIDLNRDFDVDYKSYSESRNYTLKAFSGRESKALADLIKKQKPTVVVDFHGWENYTVGDYKLAQIFKENMSLKYEKEFNNDCGGYFSYWAYKQGISSLLVEFKDDNIIRSNLKLAVDEILKNF